MNPWSYSHENPVQNQGPDCLQYGRYARPYHYIAVPVFIADVDMNAARQQPKYGAYANSDMFPGMLAKIRSGIVGGALGLRMDRIPPNVTVDPQGSLPTW